MTEVPNIRQALLTGKHRLANLGDQAAHECLILLQNVTQKTKVKLLAFDEELLEVEQYQRFIQLLERRAAGEPSAYIIEEKEFWSLPLKVTADVLIPRSDTELLVETALAVLANKQQANILDLGTGSGCIALALASELPQAQITACDRSPACLNIAQQNAKNLGLENISWHESDWFSALSVKPYDLIVSNPPYIAADDPDLASNVAEYEPTYALIAQDQGLADLNKIIQQAGDYLLEAGHLILEHGWQQAGQVQNALRQQGFSAIETRADLQGHERVSMAQYSSHVR
ncbi:MAG: peptide chain release factor N(5)-glutamine methyltransferase [Gammaproteobacteria bacterium]|nr:peptide chain release factor N(5)-glutamine methyltransferase [Gammaproteobacteria bacterium]